MSPRAAALALGAFAATALAACALFAPAREVRVRVDTDAPVPGSPSAALFDLLMVDVLPAGTHVPCEGCAQEMGVTHAMFVRGEVRFAVTPEEGSGTRARVRLLRSAARTGIADAPPEATIERVVTIPADGTRDLLVRLPTDEVGVVRDLDAPTDAPPDDGGPSTVGTWAEARRRGCADVAPSGAWCVPGGAFWLGATGASPWFDAQPLHLAVMSPFFLDATERTDAEGDLPRAAVGLDAARDDCRARGGDLPTDAQLAYVAGALRSAAHPWGEAGPECAWTALAKSIGGIDCRLGGPRPVGSYRRDRVILPAGEVVDLAGNLAEWVRDTAPTPRRDCFAGALLRDPVCDAPGAPLRHGGSFADDAATLGATGRARRRVPDGAASSEIGFRCAFRALAAPP